MPTSSAPNRLVPLAALLVAVAAVVALLVAGGAGDELGRLSTLEEASLAYPGSTEIDRGDYPRSSSPTGEAGATLWRLLGVDASPRQLSEYFATELGRLGWEEGLAISTTDELAAHAWERGDVTFRLGIRDPNHWRADASRSARYGTIYDVRLIGPSE